jgi:CheY-like chemotaxis protein
VPPKLKSILLVDDDPDDQLLFSEAVSEADMSIVCSLAYDGVDAIERLSSGEIGMPDLLFMDMNMPKMNGIDCLKELQKSEQFKNIPVIMYSTSCISEYQRECFEHGAIGYIEKPSDFSVLCNKLKLLLSKDPDTLRNEMPITL